MISTPSKTQWRSKSRLVTVATRSGAVSAPCQASHFNWVAYQYYVKGVYSLDQRGAGIEAKAQMEATFALFNKHAAEQPLAAAAPTPPKPRKLSMRDMLTRGRLQAER